MEENRTTRTRSSATRPPRRSVRLFSNRRFVCSAEAKALFVPKKNLRHDDSSISRRRCSTAKKRATSTVRGGHMRARVATRPTAMRARASALLARATFLRSRCWRPRPRRVMGFTSPGTRRFPRASCWNRTTWPIPATWAPSPWRTSTTRATRTGRSSSPSWPHSTPGARPAARTTPRSRASSRSSTRRPPAGISPATSPSSRR